jgi:hypothetical protein
MFHLLLVNFLFSPLEGGGVLIPAATKVSIAAINILTLVKLAPCSAPRLKMLNQHST